MELGAWWMKLLFCSMLFAPCSMPFAQTPQESSCVTCHKQLDAELLAPVTMMENDVHAHNGFGCESCHGGNPSPAVAEDPEAAMSRAAGYIAKPSRKNIPQLCGKCHSDPALIKNIIPPCPRINLPRIARASTASACSKWAMRKSRCAAIATAIMAFSRRTTRAPRFMR